MTAGFSHLSVRGYRRLSEVDLPLRGLNVLIGTNGVGKSSVLDVLKLFADSAEGNLSGAINQSGGLSSLLTADGKHRTVELGLLKQMPEFRASQYPDLKKVFDYRIILGELGVGYKILKETLVRSPATENRLLRLADVQDIILDESNINYRHGGRLIKPDWNYRPLETALRVLMKDSQSKSRWNLGWLHECCGIGCASPGLSWP